MAAVIPFRSKEPEVSGFVRPSDLPFTCTDARLLEAVQCYLLGEKEEEIARLLHIPLRALKHWTSAKGWRFLAETLREPVRKAVAGQTQRLASKLVAKLEEQLEKGDPVFDMEGNEIGRRAVRFKDLATSFGTVVSKQLELEKSLGPQVERKVHSLDDLMDFLREQGAKREKVIEGESASS